MSATRDRSASMHCAYMLCVVLVALFTQAHSQDVPVVTVTIRKTCERTTTLRTTTFPTIGWATTNGTAIRYTFPPSSKTASGASEDTSTRGSQLWSEPGSIVSTSSTSLVPPSKTTTTTSNGSDVSRTVSGSLSSISTSTSVLSMSSSSPGNQATSSLVTSRSILEEWTVTTPDNTMPSVSTASTTLRDTSTSACAEAEPSSITCPSSNGTLYTPAGACIGSQDTFVVFCGMELTSGNLIRFENISGEEACIDMCRNDPDCVAVAYDTTDSSCFQKSSVVSGNATASPNLIFAVRLASYTPNESATILSASESRSLTLSPPNSASVIIASTSLVRSSISSMASSGVSSTFNITGLSSSGVLPPFTGSMPSSHSVQPSSQTAFDPSSSSMFGGSSLTISSTLSAQTTALQSSRISDNGDRASSLTRVASGDSSSSDIAGASTATDPSTSLWQTMSSHSTLTSAASGSVSAMPTSPGDTMVSSSQSLSSSVGLPDLPASATISGSLSTLDSAVPWSSSSVIRSSTALSFSPSPSLMSTLSSSASRMSQSYPTESSSESVDETPASFTEAATSTSSVGLDGNSLSNTTTTSSSSPLFTDQTSSNVASSTQSGDAFTNTQSTLGSTFTTSSIETSSGTSTTFVEIQPSSHSNSLESHSSSESSSTTTKSVSVELLSTSTSFESTVQSSTPSSTESTVRDLTTESLIETASEITASSSSTVPYSSRSELDTIPSSTIAATTEFSVSETTTHETSSSTTTIIPSTTCAFTDKHLASAPDGSEFLLPCNQGFQRVGIPGTSPTQASSFDACVELCSDKGTACAGVVFGKYDGQDDLCLLNVRMLALGPSNGVVAAVRMSGPDGQATRTRLLENGAFDNGLTLWESGVSSTGSVYIVSGGAAQIKLELGSQIPRPRLERRQAATRDSSYLRQVLTGSSLANTPYYMSLDIGFEQEMPGSAQCEITATNGIGDIFLDLDSPMVDGVRNIYGSGTVETGSIPEFMIDVACTGSTNVLVSLDNIVLDVYPVSASNTAHDPSSTETMVTTSEGPSASSIQNPSTSTTSEQTSSSISSDNLQSTTGTEVESTTTTLDIVSSITSLETAVSTTDSGGQSVSTTDDEWTSSTSFETTHTSSNSEETVTLTTLDTEVSSTTSLEITPDTTMSGETTLSSTSSTHGSILISTETTVSFVSSDTISDLTSTSTERSHSSTSSDRSTSSEDTSSSLPAISSATSEVSIGSTSEALSSAAPTHETSSTMAETTSSSTVTDGIFSTTSEVHTTTSSTISTSTMVPETTSSSFSSLTTITTRMESFDTTSSSIGSISSISSISSNGASSTSSEALSSSTASTISSSTTAETLFSTTSTVKSSSTSTTSSETSVSITPTPSIQPKPECPRDDKQTYTNDDGSQFMIVCNQEYTGNNVVGITPITTSSFSACVDLCMYQGTACMGATWVGRDTNCFLKSKMLPSAYPGYLVNSAIRVSGPISGPRSSQLVRNGAFDTNISGWTGAGSSGTNVGWAPLNANGAAYFSMSGLTAMQSKLVSMTQDISGADAGLGYFVTARIELPGDPQSCSVAVVAGSVTLLSYNYAFAKQSSPVNASGILTSASTTLRIQFTCRGKTTTAANGLAFVDDVALSVFPQSAGTNPIRPVAKQVATNNDFSSGSFAPWTTSSTTNRMTFSIVNGRATITYNQIDSTYTSPSSFYQILSPPAEAGQNVRITADVWIFTPNAGTKCTAQISCGNEFFLVGDVGSGYYRVDRRLTLTSAGNSISLYATCTGTGATTNVQFDNVYVTLNEF